MKKIAKKTNKTKNDPKGSVKNPESVLSMQMLLNAFSDFAILADEKGIILCANTAAKNILSGKSAYFTGKSIYDLLPSELNKLIRQNITKLKKDKQLHRFEDFRNNKWIELNFHPVQDENGVVVKIAIYGKDITEQKNREEALRENEERYRTAHETAGAGIAYYSPAGVILSYNKIARDYMNGKSQEFTGKSIYEVFPKDEAEFYLKRIRKAARSAFPQEYTDKINVPSGLKWFQSIFTRITSPAGKVKGIQIISTDITERMKTEELLQASESKFRMLFQEMMNGFALHEIICNEQGKPVDYRFLDVNPAFERMTDLYLNDISGRTVLDVIPGFDKTWIERYGKVALTGEPVTFETYTESIKKYFEVNSFSPAPKQFACILSDITERKQAEKALQNSESRFKELFENIGSGVAIYEAVNDGSDFVFRNFNKAAEQMYNVSRDDLNGKSVQNVFPGVKEFGLFDVLSRVWKTGNPERHPVNMYKDDKITGWYENYVYKLPSGEIVAVFENLTEQKQAETALRVSESKFRAVIENIHDAISFTDAAGYMLYRNPALNKISGYTDEERIGKSAFDLIHPDDQDYIRRILKDSLEHPEKTHDILFRSKNKNGSWKHLEATVYNLIENPDIKAILQISRDITERKLVEDALRENEERFKNLVESVTDYIYTVQVENGNVVKTIHGPGCLGITGYSCNELETDMQLWFNMIYKDDRDFVINELNKVITGENIPPIEHRIYHKNGSLRWVRNSPVPRMNENNKVIVYDGMISDITERKNAEETRERLEGQLRQSQKMEALGTFVGGIAHDFNNILSVLIGYTNLLNMEISPDNPVYSYVDQILSSSEKAANLTKSLLSFSRKQPVLKKQINVNKAVREIDKLLARIVTEDIKLEIKLDDQDMIIDGDPSQIDQIFLNLATNARDALPHGGKITISTKLMEFDESLVNTLGYGKPGKYYVMITFSDNGMGIDERIKDKIFDPFFTTKEIGKGTGLGMSTVYNIIQQHNGHITLCSVIGAGTIFQIFFPVEDSVIETEQISALNIQHGNETVLIAEDNDNVRSLMKAVLTKYGYAVIEAVDGLDAVEKFRYHKNIDLVIIDSVMPGKNGREVYNDIIKINEKIKVLFCSGYTKDVALNKGIEEQELDFLAKPIIPNILLEKVREILDRK